MKCEAGDLCVIIGEDRGCECNIGAMLRVTQKGRNGEWVFEKASRPLYTPPTPQGHPVAWVTESTGHGIGWEVTIPEQYLMPIKPGGLPAPVSREIEIETI